MNKKLYTYNFVVFLLVLLLAQAAPFRSHAQLYGNEWIQPGQNYFKFKIAQKGLYRIYKTQLDAIGIGNIPGSQFAIFRDGQEVPLYTSTTGTFGATDYIEFLADAANGIVDAELYPNSLFQPATDINLLSDSAAYFLTYSNAVHQRLSLINNSIPLPAPSPAAYCIMTARPLENNRAVAAPGRSHTNADYFYSSDFDLGEGWGYYFGTNGTLNIPTPNISSAGPQPYINFVYAGHSTIANPQHVYVKLNNSSLFDSVTTNTFSMVKKTITLSSAALSSNNQVNFSDAYNFIILHGSLTYSAGFNFSGSLSNKVSFQLPASERYLEINGFNTGGQIPLLVDINSNKIYQGSESGGVVRFYLDISATPRKLFLTNATSVQDLSSFVPVQFRDYSNTANQGDYLILSHKNYINATPAYVAEYSQYRSSLQGGSHTPVVVDVTELYDQFGWGADFSALAVRRFIKFANDTWTTKPKFLFIIGKGITYTEHLAYLQSSAQYSYSPVPTWGWPGADNLFSSYNNSQKPILATGRLSAWNNTEIGNYLTKVQAYENSIKPSAVPTVANDYWKKRALHIAGSSDLALQQQLINSLNTCKAILEDTLVGGSTTTIAKSSTDPVEEVNSARIDSLINNGLGYISFYGHASSAGFDYNLNSPDIYHSNPNFPAFFAFGCNVANVFPLSQMRTVSENYIRSVNGGSIMMMAGNNTGWTGTLSPYMRALYQSFCYREYGKTLGEQYQKNIEWLQNTYTDAFMDIHTQSLLYLGDPALIRYNPLLPDYAVEETGLSANPANVTTATDTFTLKAIAYNLGKTVADSIWIKLEHTLSGQTTVKYSDSVFRTRLYNTDTILFKIPVDATTDIGLNNYTITVDAGDRYPEIFEQNNKATLQLFIYSENLVPVYPKEFAIVHEQGITLKSSTLNAFAPARRYKLEIDTTENFNSTLKQSTEVISSGGVVKWTPSINYQDSVVYYWRSAADTLVNGALNWTNSSFIYLAGDSDGWNQSHYFQMLKNRPFHGLDLPSANRKFRFSALDNTLKIENKVIVAPLNDYHNMRSTLNDVVLRTGGCAYTGALYIIVIDSASGQPLLNESNGSGGSEPICYTEPLKRQMFEFSTANINRRNAAKDFLESIPDGQFIAIYNWIYVAPGSIQWDRQAAAEWMADQNTNGAGISLYHTFKNLGFDQIDQFDSRKVFAFFMKKGDASSRIQVVAPDTVSKIELYADYKSYPDTGIVHSQVVGPALEWQSLKWRSSATDNVPVNDSPFVMIYGIDSFSNETLVYSGFSRDTSLSFISASQFPNLKLKWYSVDNITRSSAQLDYWRVLYRPVPEAALNAAINFSFIDSLQEGQTGNLKMAVENLSPYPMDSMLVSFKVIDANNVKHNLSEVRYKPLSAYDTLNIDLSFDPKNYPGKNFLFIEANPNRDQPEQYHPNNLGYLPFYMQADKLNPILDVTFDGVHILDKDIVSAKPLIKVMMNDENHFEHINDTALLKIQLLYPNQSTPVDVPVDGVTCRFFPSQVGATKNEAYIDYTPSLTEDGVYKLIVSGKDKAGNLAGNTSNYEINFTVENKPTITHLLNYPNPFSTSTQFIFTMTGSEIPSQFKIQILTVTGKIVREIRKDELGNLHIGRNITDYRWDGKDEYGQMLGNGVYLYRVITSIRGKDIEQRQNKSIDKYFKNGYGKLYIMR